MVRRRISEAQRWQIIGMHTTGMSFKAIERQMKVLLISDGFYLFLLTDVYWAASVV
jgi:hypothetical protein